MITKQLDEILEKNNIPFYDDMPDFSGTGVPNKFIVYNYSEIPNVFADDEETVTEYDITINIFTSAIDKELYKQVKKDLKEADFIYCGDLPFDIDSFYPGKFRKIQNYKKVMEE